MRPVGLEPTTSPFTLFLQGDEVPFELELIDIKLFRYLAHLCKNLQTNKTSPCLILGSPFKEKWQEGAILLLGHQRGVNFVPRI
jgi:hypothetical protein